MYKVEMVQPIKNAKQIKKSKGKQSNNIQSLQLIIQLETSHETNRFRKTAGKIETNKP